MNKLALFHINKHLSSSEPSMVNLLGWIDQKDGTKVTKEDTDTRFASIEFKGALAGTSVSATGTLRPYTGRTVNGVEVIDFRLGQGMRGSFTEQSQPLVIIWLGKRDTLLGSSQVQKYFAGTDNGIQTNAESGTSGDLFIYAGTITAAEAATDLDTHVYCEIIDGINSILYEDGINIISGYNIGSNGLSGIALGIRGSSDLQYLDGVIGDFFIYNALISNTEINKTLSYLYGVYGKSGNLL